MATGMLIGTFMPPHAGHQFLVDFARAWADELTLLCYVRDADPVPADLRKAWLREMFVGIEIRMVSADLPDTKDDAAAVNAAWTKHLCEQFPDGVDYVFGSEPVCAHIAAVLDAQYMALDHHREMVAAHGSDIRENPIANWQYLPAVARAHYVKRVCLYGPGAEGKTALAEQLATHYQSVAALEFGRRALELSGGKCSEYDLERITRAQLASEDALARQANRVLICDTDPLAMSVWSQLRFGHCSDVLRTLASERSYDLYLLVDVDVPWTGEPDNFFNDQSPEAFDLFRGALIREDRRYLRLDGDYDTRFRIACDGIDNLIGQTTGRPVRLLL